tara:strand:+ start:144 stop:788 length:645 start_codon:yes stop_codon:yes gene_type:complete
MFNMLWATLFALLTASFAVAAPNPDRPDKLDNGLPLVTAAIGLDAVPDLRNPAAVFEDAMHGCSPCEGYVSVSVELDPNDPPLYVGTWSGMGTWAQNVITLSDGSQMTLEVEMLLLPHRTGGCLPLIDLQGAESCVGIFPCRPAATIGLSAGYTITHPSIGPDPVSGFDTTEERIECGKHVTLRAEIESDGVGTGDFILIEIGCTDCTVVQTPN